MGNFCMMCAPGAFKNVKFNAEELTSLMKDFSQDLSERSSYAGGSEYGGVQAAAEAAAGDGSAVTVTAGYFGHTQHMLVSEDSSLFGFTRVTVPVIKLTREQFGQLMARFGTTAEVAENLFRVFDLNKDGTIDFVEFACGMGSAYTFSCPSDRFAVLCRGSQTEKINFLFKVFDLDGDGTVSLDELRYALRISLNAGEKILSTHHMSLRDLNFVQQVDDYDYLMSSLTHSFRLTDKNLDGKISAKEFLTLAKDNPDLVALLDQFEGMF
eukprot:TRINITY_DN3809_c0_g1_i1.p1 TRINITY_DN3809_c0_g1~~TRINITY_DN3809_c0_g1_i1.p1  ORF type:complete len:286 (+),score=67.45 TRINITY_DN3809_c0_g1_i1:55-858(+)